MNKDFYFISNGNPVFPVGAQVHNSSGYAAKDLDRAFLALKAMDANTVEIPVYWESVEPKEGQFEFSHIREIVNRVKEQNLYLIFVWFGTWKNGTAKYAPSWVKQDTERFARVETPDGTKISVLSSHCEETKIADAKAFSVLCEFLNELDPYKETLIALQVENESGIMNGPVRDHSSIANEKFQASVPQGLLEHLKTRTEGFAFQQWEKCGSRSGSWAECFGDRAEEFFTAFGIASFIDYVTAEGRKKIDIMMYTNAWVRPHRWRIPGIDFPSGGPVNHVMDIWKWAAPNLDLLAPDIYQQTHADYFGCCRDYARDDNPLFVPESGPQEWNSRFLFEALGKYRSIGHFIFGVEDLVDENGAILPGSEPTMGSMKSASAIAGGLLHWKKEKINVISQDEYAYFQYMEFDNWACIARFSNWHPMVGGENGDWNWFDYQHYNYREIQRKENRRGRGLAVQTGPSEFYVTGDAFRLIFLPKKRISGESYKLASADFNVIRETGYISVEEGRFTMDGKFHSERKRNGDEVDFGIWVEPDVGVVRVVLQDL